MGYGRPTSSREQCVVYVERKPGWEGHAKIQRNYSESIENQGKKFDLRGERVQG